MRRGVALYLVGSSVLLALAGCGRWLSFEEREPWRREAELACIKSGTVKQTATITPVKAIEGPGVCGAEYPFKVAALGEISALGYASDVRPPGSVPRGFPNAEPSRAAPFQTRAAPSPNDRPLSSDPAGSEPDEDDETDNYDVDPFSARPGSPPARGNGQPAQSYPERYQQPRAPRQHDLDVAEPPRLGPSREPAFANAGAAEVKPAATLACPMVSALDSWMAGSVQPAAQRWFGQPVVEIKQISAYSCRGMNGNRSARISEHAFGNALDIAAFTLADGRHVTVKDGWRGEPEEQAFLRDVHASACQQFSTVLAPGSNIYHYDHIHVDLARRQSGRSVCNPRAIPGDLIARRRGDPAVTGSLGKDARRRGFADEFDRKGLEAKLPRAIPGED